MAANLEDSGQSGPTSPRLMDRRHPVHAGRRMPTGGIEIQHGSLLVNSDSLQATSLLATSLLATSLLATSLLAPSSPTSLQATSPATWRSSRTKIG
jgi:hypothetical protein